MLLLKTRKNIPHVTRSILLIFKVIFFFKKEHIIMKSKGKGINMSKMLPLLRGCIYFSVIITLSFPLLAENNRSNQNVWPGQYPLNGFFQDKKIRTFLKKFLPFGQLKHIEKDLSTVTPIELKENFLIISGCKPHDCPTENYLL